MGWLVEGLRRFCRGLLGFVNIFYVFKRVEVGERRKRERLGVVRIFRRVVEGIFVIWKIEMRLF